MTSEVTSRFTCVTSADADPSISSEIAAEDAAIAHMHATLGAGLTVLKASNISRPLSTFCKETGTQIPARMDAVEVFCDDFIEWQVARKKKPEEIATWSTPAAFEDIRKVVVRKVWLIKLQSGSIYDAKARRLAVFHEFSKILSGKTYEAVGHAAKHNEHVNALLGEMLDGIKAVHEESYRVLLPCVVEGNMQALIERNTKLLEDKADD